MNNFYISDLHLGHFNIISFDNRPFKDCVEMEKTITNNWNSVVSAQDMVYILGDFCWSSQEQEWIRILQNLNGQKTLIKGNHDLKNMSCNLKKYFSDIKDYKEINDNGIHIIMSHYPIMCYKSSYNPNCYMLYGHVHNNTLESNFVKNWTKELKLNRTLPFANRGNLINVGCMMDYMNYTPKTINELISLTLRKE